ncbi:NADPH-dependent FMN reductase [Actinotalea caeni]|uniref:NADPH-dependent FMN reductase n=1 Tax=Actinotalea caeni TaxID=1348467 RepID=UPI001F04C27A|nr:NAD(P)H-dependent oxidoreductase [Actinotalea caeni]
MTKLRIAVVIGSTRPGRKGEAVGRWVHELAQGRDAADYDLVDVAAFDLPLLSEPTVPGSANRRYEVPQTRAWSETIDRYDGFVWVSPEYNHGVPAAMKNALDVLYPEWGFKGFGIVSYGADGGTRATEQWRGILANVMGTVVRHQVALYEFLDWDDDGAFAPLDRRPQELRNLLDLLERTTAALAPLRA